MTCDRCRQETSAHTMSMFNSETICMGCKDTEKGHPQYAEALAAERAAYERGERMFPGVGLPADLRPYPVVPKVTSEKRLFALRYLESQWPEKVESRAVMSAWVAATHDRTSVRSSEEKASGWGLVLSQMAALFLVERDWERINAGYVYRIKDLGKEALREAERPAGSDAQDAA